MIRIAVCDDQRDDLEQVVHHIRLALDCLRIDASVSSFSSGHDLLAAHEADGFQLVFLDIYMQPLSGVDIARDIRERDDACRIVFITMSRDHAIEGFEVRASHYLTKPITTESVIESLERCTEDMVDALRSIVFRIGKLDMPVLLKDIESIEVFNKVSIVHTRTGEIKTYQPLDRLETELGGPPFLRCHRCAIVNMRWIEAYTATDFVMRGGRTVPIRQSESVAIRQMYLDYLFAEARRG